MADFPSRQIRSQIITSIPGVSPEAYQQAPQYPATLTVDTPSALSPSANPGWNETERVDHKSDFARLNFSGFCDFQTTPAFDWFDNIHVVPRRIDLGNVLTAQVVEVEVWSAYRTEPHDWDDLINNVGNGVNFLNLPSLPATIPPQSGYIFQVEVTTSAPPLVDTTLDYVFDVYTTPQPITFRLVILWPVPPEIPYTELLEFLTDVQLKTSGVEYRAALRKNPRQVFEWRHVLDDGPERQNIDNILFDWQARIFGIPIWHELTRLTSPVVTDDLTIDVQSTDFADYRIDGLALIYSDQSTFDVLTVIDITPTTLTFETAVQNDYPLKGTLVMPLRVGRATRILQGGRYRVGANTLQVRFTVDDNDSNLADTSAFSQYKGKVLLDDCNVVPSSQMPEVNERQITVIDGNVGKVSQSSSWDRGRRGSSKSFSARGRQGTWEVRQLMHALRGRQVSFYLPTFVTDLTATVGLTALLSTLNIVNVGYDLFVRGRGPKNEIRITFKDGSAPLLREIIDSEVLSNDEEQLTVDAAWPNTVALEDIARIEYVEIVRFDSDRIRFQHRVGSTSVLVTAPVKTILE